MAAAAGRREQNKLENRARIIAAARALFTHKGFEATTAQEIAAAAGLASGTLFNYARTKDELLILVFHSEMLEVIERAYVAAAAREHLLVQATSFFETLVAYHARDLPLSQALMGQLGYVSNPSQRALVAELMNALLGRLADLIEAARSGGEVAADRPVRACARSLFAIYYFHLGRLLGGYVERARFDRALKTDLGLLLRGWH